MRLVIVAVGLRVPDWAQTAWDDYAKRFPHEIKIELKAVKTEPRGSKTLDTLYAAERTRIEAAILFMAVILVFAIEIINTAIEKVFDLLHPGDHEIIRGVKDAMAGAVLISAVIAFVVATLIFCFCKLVSILL